MSRNKAFISGIVKRRLARTEPWHAIVPSSSFLCAKMRSERPCSIRSANMSLTNCSTFACCKSPEFDAPQCFPGRYEPALRLRLKTLIETALPLRLLAHSPPCSQALTAADLRRFQHPWQLLNAHR